MIEVYRNMLKTKRKCVEKYHEFFARGSKNSRICLFTRSLVINEH